MTFSLRPPLDRRARALLDAQCDAPFTYDAVGATAADRGGKPRGFDYDAGSCLLGQGNAVFEAARAAVRSWRMFDLGWVHVFWQTTPIHANELVAIATHQLGLWTLNACRIVYVVDQPTRFGFAYGTLPRHVESGEERFLVTHRADDSVVYEISAFSRPRHPLARFGKPYVRLLQARFRRGSCLAMQRNIAKG